MENRLELNKRPVYELPDEIEVGLYQNIKGRKMLIPNFEPDICLNMWGKIGKPEQKYETINQIWVRSSNKKLLQFIKNTDFKKEKDYFIAPVLSMNVFKKIILEEFYNLKTFKNN